ncbi:hypothetical protein GLOTRDRAFT_127510 [Gloeophyllum trabeum ATCC 11539]|uniref:Zn(2)-C6 fungal-type domain-containing protein n=1 Tax=Gloeophyllum trabeum (strain ATCC 11539 / FP-39264 / Madison 617) TaxID=670483 RepID=S7RV86_GLOTA|nr:uncharacterized protein GLOTRDRAFT_127510 [Gloeophyllum trabeum ATCC 11539]EPQ57139.1 hypothetical protein GLOTRDRAFT_127510 [Gloeophyllum trabeum ATCC 11539]
MSNLLPSGYVAPYGADLEHAAYGSDYVDAHETRSWVVDGSYYYANNVYESNEHWQQQPVASDQYGAEPDLVNHYLDSSDPQSSGVGVPTAPFATPGIPAEPYTQAYDGGLGGDASNPATYWNGQQRVYGDGAHAFAREESDGCCPSRHHVHLASPSSSVPGSSFPHGHAHGYGFASKDTLADSTHLARPGDATSPQPVDQQDWGNLSRSSQDPRIDFGPYQAPKESTSTVQAPETVGYPGHDFRPLVPPTSTTPSPSRLPYGFAPHQPPTDADQELVQPSFFVPSQQTQRLDDFKEQQRERRAATRAAISPYYAQSGWHNYSYESSETPIMDHLPLPEDVAQPGTMYQQQDAQSPQGAATTIIPSQPGPSPLTNLALAQFEQARAENARKHDLYMGRTYLPDRDDLPPAPTEPWARALPTHARPHPLVLSADGYHPLVKPEPQEYSMSSASPMSPVSPVKTDGTADVDSKTQHRMSSPSTSKTSKKVCEKKPVLACLFCRGRKIACGPPSPGSKDKTCNQCARRHLKCIYPTESRRGQRKRAPKVPVQEDVTGAPNADTNASSASTSAAGSSSKGNRKHRKEPDQPGT